MRKLTQAERRDWMHGTERAASRVRNLVGVGLIQCDDCGDEALTLGHRGQGSEAAATCGPCFRKRLDAERATRPSRDELFARVNEAIA